jgi:HPt (histidine-containing phosphotransfer) domain-containing protein
VNIRQLGQYLRSLAGALRESGASKVAGDLEAASVALEPFGDRAVKDFAEFLARAQEYERTGIVSVVGTGRRAKSAAAIDQEKIAAKAQQVQQLIERAIDAEVTFTVIDTEVKKLEKALTKDEAVQLAQEVGAGKCKNKKEALAEITRMIKDRKLNYERTRPIRAASIAPL